MPNLTTSLFAHVLAAISLVGVIVLACMGKPIPTLLATLAAALVGGSLGITVPGVVSSTTSVSSPITNSTPGAPTP